MWFARSLTIAWRAEYGQRRLASRWDARWARDRSTRSRRNAASASERASACSARNRAAAPASIAFPFGVSIASCGASEYQKYPSVHASRAQRIKIRPIRSAPSASTPASSRLSIVIAVVMANGVPAGVNEPSLKGSHVQPIPQPPGSSSSRSHARAWSAASASPAAMAASSTSPCVIAYSNSPGPKIGSSLDVRTTGSSLSYESRSPTRAATSIPRTTTRSGARMTEMRRIIGRRRGVRTP